ncbi:hypothetical protein GCM10018987_04150 [Streptomyces cremeus]
MTFLAGLALKLFGTDEQIVWVTPTKAGVVLMVVGGCLLVAALLQSLRGAGASRT